MNIPIGAVPENFTLIQNYDEVVYALSYMGEERDFTYLFAEIKDGDYGHVYGSYTCNIEDTAYFIQ